jgi:hypothetical protein
MPTRRTVPTARPLVCCRVCAAGSQLLSLPSDLYIPYVASSEITFPMGLLSRILGSSVGGAVLPAGGPTAPISTPRFSPLLFLLCLPCFFTLPRSEVHITRWYGFCGPIQILIQLPWSHRLALASTDDPAPST